MSRSRNNSTRYRKEPKLRARTKNESDLLLSTHVRCSTGKIYRRNRHRWGTLFSKARRRYDDIVIKENLESLD